MKINISHAYREGHTRNLLDPSSKKFRKQSPEDITILRSAKNQSAGYQHGLCPAVHLWYRNKWEVVLNQDLDIRLNKEKKEYQSNFPDELDLFVFHENKNVNNIEIQVISSHLFWTKSKDVWVQLLHHPGLSFYNIELIPGTFPISVWPREIQFAFKLINTNLNNIHIPKGTPLYYASFYSRYQDPEFIIKQQDLDDEITKKITEIGDIKNTNPAGAWPLIKRLLSKDKPSKCPFKFLWN